MNSGERTVPVMVRRRLLPFRLALIVSPMVKPLASAKGSFTTISSVAFASGSAPERRIGSFSSGWPLAGSETK